MKKHLTKADYTRKETHKENYFLVQKYQKTSKWYDFLDAYWERSYQKFRHLIMSDLYGKILEAAVGTGRNLPFYPPSVDLTAFDLSENMLAIAKTRKPTYLTARFLQADATLLHTIDDAHFDWYISTFLYCVMPNHLQALAINQMIRVLKPGGRFRILEMVYSKRFFLKLRQWCFAPFVYWVYGAAFNRPTLTLLNEASKLKITNISFLKEDTYLLIEGEKTD